jgi:hypothetical protein
MANRSKLFRHADPKVDREFENAYRSLRSISTGATGAAGPPGVDGVPGAPGTNGINAIQSMKKRINQQREYLGTLPANSFITELWGIIVSPYTTDVTFELEIDGTVEGSATNTVLVSQQAPGVYTRFWPFGNFYGDLGFIPNWRGDMYFIDVDIYILNNALGGEAVVCLNYITTSEL